MGSKATTEYCSYDISLRFRFDGLQDLFEGRQALPVYTTRSFGPGWRITLSPDAPGALAKEIHLRFLPGKKHKHSLSISLEVRMSSLMGDITYAELSSCTTIPADATRAKWALLERNLWNEAPTLKEENAAILHVNIRSPSGPTSSADGSLDLLHKTLIRSSVTDVRFHSYRSRTENGQLDEYRTLRADRKLIYDECSRLYDVLYGDQSSGIFALHNSRHEDGSAPQTSYLDADSDFEEDSVENDLIVSGIEEDGMQDAETDGGQEGEPIEEATTRGQEREPIEDDTARAIQRSAEHNIHIPHEDNTAGEQEQNGSQNAAMEICVDEQEPGLKPVFQTFDASHQDQPGSPRVNQNLEEQPSEPASGIQGGASEFPGKGTAPPHPDKDLTHVVVTGAASTTWESFLFYIYTGKVHFAPLKVEGINQRKTYIKNYKRDNPDRPEPCSCKSMYRLADEFDLTSLKALALDHLMVRLDSRTVVPELFSKFTSKYEEVKKLEIEFLMRHWDEISRSAVFQETLKDAAKGRYPHTNWTMAAIFQHLSTKAVK